MPSVFRILAKTAYDLMAHFGTLEALMGATEQELVDIEDVRRNCCVVDCGVFRG
ncbi:MAG: helix-hairpin-helix domain-containing protein [Christensenellales bacterium]